MRDLFGAWTRGDSFAHAEAYDSDVEFVMVGEFFPDPGTYRGIEAMSRAWLGWLNAWENFHTGEPELVDLDDRVICFYTIQGRGKTSGIEVEAPVAAILTLREGKVIRLVLCTREQGLKEAGLGE